MGAIAILAAALRCAQFSFVGSNGLPQMRPAPRLEESPVARRAKLTAKEKQIERSKKKAEKKKSAGEVKWPIAEWPKGAKKVLHIEYDEEAEASQRERNMGHIEMYKFHNAVWKKCGTKVKMIFNAKKALMELSPTKTFRKGSFEVVDCYSKKTLFSKLQTGVDLVYDEAYFNMWMDKLLA